MVEQQEAQQNVGCRPKIGSRETPRLCPLWLTLLLSAAAALLLAELFPENHIKAKSIAAYSPSALSLAYLEAGLNTEPESLEHLDILAEQNLKLARWQVVIDIAERMERFGNDKTARQRALALQLMASEQLVYALDESDPLRQQRLQRFETLLGAARLYTWTVPEMYELARRAQGAGTSAVAAELYRELARMDPANASWWQAKRAEAALAMQAYDSAADAYFAAYRLAETTRDKRAYFIAALQVLESGNQIQRATWQAHQ